MKNSLIFVILLAAAVVVASILYSKRAKTPPPAGPVAESPVQPAPNSAPEPEATPQPPARVTAPAAAPEEVTTRAKVEPANPIHKLVDSLLHAANAKQKHELFEQLRKSGQLDDAIAELKQRAAENPKDAGIPTTLGEAQLNKLRTIHESGGDTDELGILAMQADQNFNAALKIDPANWEAQFVKASSLFYWPADPTRDNDVVRRLSSLIDQQEGLPPRPEFAQTYVVLGNQYQKIGEPDKAQATWELGLQKFPADAVLQKKAGKQ